MTGGLRYKASAARRMVCHVIMHPANRTHRLRSLVSAVEFQVTGRLFGRRKLVPIGNHSRIWADVHNGASFKAFCGNPPDWNEMLAWRKLLKPGDIFVDVGANVGSYTLWAADLGAEVIAIEPDSDSIPRLLENIDLNGYQVEVLRVALGSEPGSMLLTRGLGANHFLFGSELNTDSQPVEVGTLDRVIGDRTAVGVKIDVEGAELLVLQGAEAALRERRICCLQLEWNSTSQELFGQTRQPVIDLLSAFGYGLFKPDSTGSLQPVDGMTDALDVFAKPLSDVGGCKG